MSSDRLSNQGRVLPVYTSDCEGVLFTHELVGALLPFSGRVTIGEIVTVETLTGSALGAVSIQYVFHWK